MPFAASSFGIDPSSGRLSHLAVSPLVCAMAYIATDRSGRFLLAASYTDARLAIYPIDAAGRIEACPTQLTPTGPNAHCVVVDAANRFAYCAVLGADHVMELLFDPETGTFAPNAPPTLTTRARSGPHLAFHPNGRLLYLLNQIDATIVAYRIEPGSGVLAEIETGGRHWLERCERRSGPRRSGGRRSHPAGSLRTYGNEPSLGIGAPAQTRPNADKNQKRAEIRPQHTYPL